MGPGIGSNGGYHGIPGIPQHGNFHWDTDDEPLNHIEPY